MINELCTTGAVELASMIRTGRATATQVVSAHLARIEEVNPDLNAVRVALTDSALSAATDVDRAIAAGEPVGPLAGVPFTVKENVDVAGSATTWGVPALAGQLASTDAPAVARLREAGAIPLARTNLPDFALRWDTMGGLGGRTLNPWDATRTAGGSSGGEAVSLATGMSTLGLGNDLGGSLRIPSQMCGIAAIKPTRGRVAHSSVSQPWPEPISLQMTMTQGPMARRVADLRLALRIISAPDARDARWVPAPFDYRPDQRPVRVAVAADPAGMGVHPHVRAGIDRAAGFLSNAGYEVVEAEPPQIMAAVTAWCDAIWADVSLLWPQLQTLANPEQIAFVDALLEHGLFGPVDQAKQQATWQAVQSLSAAWGGFLQDYPIILSPVSCEPAWLLGEDITRVGEIAAGMRMVVPVNILGLPAAAVPMGADDGMPQGVQLAGASFTETLLLDAAQAIEDRVGALTPIQPRVATLV